MRVGPWPDPALPVYTPDPVNRHHPLNRGRASWWLTLPNLAGGRYWPDLMGLYPATLTNLTTSASGWRGTTRPGGAGHVLFDGSDDLADVGDPAGLAPGTGDFTLAGWMRLDSTPVTTCALVGRGDTSPTRLAALEVHGSGGEPQFELYDGSSNPFVRHGSSATGTGWRRLVGARRAGTLALYVDGTLSGTATDTASNVGGGSGSKWTIGRRLDNSSTLPGALDDLSVWSRALSGQEVQADYDLSRRGYPGVLNRFRSRVSVLLTPTTTVAAVAPAGIASSESFGADTVAATAGIAPAGVASGESFGVDTAGAGAGITPGGIASTEAFGAPSVGTSGSAAVAPAGIPTGEASGSPAASAAAGVAPAGIPSAESVPAPGVGSPSLPSGLMAAIAARATADPALAGIVGGFWHGELPPDPRGSTPPAAYCVFTQASESLLFKSSTSEVTDRRVRFRVYATTSDACQALAARLLAAAPAWGALPYAGGASTALVRCGGMSDTPKGRRTGDKGAWRHEVTFSARCVEPI